MQAVCSGLGPLPFKYGNASYNIELICLTSKTSTLFVQVLMLMSQHASAREHVFSCEAVKWPLMERNIIYWIDPLTNVSCALYLLHFCDNL